jgi:CBS domain-containing protein
MKVENLMTRNVLTLRGDQTLRDAISIVQKHHIRHIPVVNGPRVVGIVTDRDIKRATPSLLSGVDQAEYERVLNETRVFQVMTREPATVTPDTDLAEAVRILIDKKFGALPVIDGSGLVGILTDTDILRAYLRILTAPQSEG